MKVLHTILTVITFASLPDKTFQKLVSSTPEETINNILTEYPVLDGHNDLPYVIRECLSNTIYDGRYNFSTDLSTNKQPWQTENCRFPNVQTDYTRIKKGHLGAQLWSVYVDCNTQYKDSIRQTVEQIDLVKRLTKDNGDFMEFCGDSDCVRNAWENGKFASLIGMEGGHSIDSSMAMIRLYHKLGVRYMSLTHFCNTPWADHSSQDDTVIGLPDKIGGLTEFGKKVVLEMNRVGIIVDLAHVNAQVMRDALEISKTSVIFSHSNSAAVFNNSRNAPDDVLMMLKQNNGVIMVNFVGYFLQEDYMNANMDKVAEHITYSAFKGIVPLLWRSTFIILTDF